MQRRAQQKNHLHYVTIVMHWLMASIVLMLFFIGIVMVELDYYDTGYYQGPWWHKGLGVILAAVLFVYQCWRCIRQPAHSLLKPGSWQAIMSTWMHFCLLSLLYLLILSGYMIVTGQGHALTVFDWFDIPALLTDDALMRWSGVVHQYGAYLLMVLVILHLLAALKHHYIDKDAVLNRMLGK